MASKKRHDGMSREEEIRQRAKEIAQDGAKSVEEACIEMAKWADETTVERVFQFLRTVYLNPPTMTFQNGMSMYFTEAFFSALKNVLTE